MVKYIPLRKDTTQKLPLYVAHIPTTNNYYYTSATPANATCMTLRYSMRGVKPENQIWTPWLSQIERPFDTRCGVPGGLERLWFGTIRARRKGEGRGGVGSWVDWFVERTWIYVVVPLRMPETPLPTAIRGFFPLVLTANA